MMDFYCEICNTQVKSKNKFKNFSSKSHIEISKCDHILFSSKDHNIDEMDEIYNLYLIELDRKYDFYKVKVIFNLLFYSNNYNKYISLKYKNKGTRFWFKQFLESVVDNFRIEEHEFDYIEELEIVTLFDKRDRAYQFYMKQKKCSLEWMNI